MSSFSPPDPVTPHIEVEEIEEVEELFEKKPAERALGEVGLAGRRGLVTALWATPGTLWLLFYLVAPVVMILLVGFWRFKLGGFETWGWTLKNYNTLFHTATYWHKLRSSFENSLIVTGATLLFGFPIAYFLTMSVKTLRNQIALFIIALAPFWTNYLIRVVAYRYPLMGRNGAVNVVLEKLGLIDQPLTVLVFSNFSVVLAMIQLYILFMITPLFFMLAQVDKSSLESARDLGANWFKTFREVILPQTMPGIVIGSIFVFVLSMGDYGTVRTVGGAQQSSVGLIVSNQVGEVQFPQAATSAVFLVLAMMIGVFILLRFSNLREEL